MRFNNYSIVGKLLSIVSLVMLTACSNSGPVAMVNGEEIAHKVFDVNIKQAEQNAKTQGKDIEDPEFRAEMQKNILDEMIGSELLLQVAQNSDVVVTDETVDGAYLRSEIQSGGEEALQAQLLQLNISEEDFREDIRKQLFIQRYLTKYLEDKDITVTDDEVQDLYDEVALENADLPPLEEVEDQVRQQVLQQKSKQIVDDHVAELREQAKVEVFLSN